MRSTLVKILLSALPLGAALTLLPSGCSSIDEAKAKEKFDIPPILRVGVLANASYTDPAAKINAELLVLLEKKHGVIIDIAKYSREEILFALRRGDVDLVAAGLTDADISAEFLTPCARFFQTGRRVAVNGSLAAFITNLNQLDNPKVVVYTVAGTVAADSVGSIFKRAAHVSLKDSAACFDKVRAGTGGVFLVGPVEGWRIFKHPQSAADVTGLSLVLGPLTKEHLAWAVRKSEQNLAKTLDDFIAKLRANGDLEKMIEESGVDAINK